MKSQITTYPSNAWFHVYNRGVARQTVFRRADDYRTFLDCFGRHLGPEPQRDSRGRPLLHLRGEISIGAHCPMPNHYHLLVRTGDDGSVLPKLMHAATTGYSHYFNRRYDRDGPLWRGRFRAKHLPTTADVMRAMAYVHLNMDDDPDYRWSSHRYFVGDPGPPWLDVSAGLAVFDGPSNYRQFIEAELLKRERQRDLGGPPTNWLEL